MSISDDKISYNMTDNNLYENPQTVLELHDDYIKLKDILDRYVEKTSRLQEYMSTLTR